MTLGRRLERRQPELKMKREHFMYSHLSVTVSPAMAPCCCCNISQCFHTMTLDEYWKDYWANYSSEQTGNKLILKKQSDGAKAEINIREGEIIKLEDRHLVYVQRQGPQNKTNMTKAIAQHKTEMKERDGHYEAEINELNDQHAVEIKTRDDQHDADVVSLVGFHEEKSREQDDQHKAEIKTKVYCNMTEVIELAAQYNEEIRKREAEIKELRDQLAIVIKKKEDQRDADVTKLVGIHEAEKKQREDQDTEEMSELNDQHATDIKSLDQKHGADMISLVEQQEAENKQQEDQHAGEIKKITDMNKVEVIKLHLELKEERRKTEKELSE